VITKVRLKSGRSAGAQATELPVASMNVFVGPNNSGKSKLISEIKQIIDSGNGVFERLVVEAIEIDSQPLPNIEDEVLSLKSEPIPGEVTMPGYMFAESKFGRSQLPEFALRETLANPNVNVANFFNLYLRMKTLTLDGPSRIGLVNPQQAGDLQRKAFNSLRVLFDHPKLRQEVRRIVSEAFDLYFVIDPTALGQMRVRLSSRAPHNEMEECGIHRDAIEFHRKALPIELGSDGLKAFTGIIMEIIAGDPKIIIVDEPEAFLHPALAYKLGTEIARAARSSDKTVFVSTHSPHFLMGCVQFGSSVNVTRLTYRSGAATSRFLPSDELSELMKDPLLRSANVLSALFYEFVIVTESDADRAFYQEVNERLLRFRPDWGISNCLFINAQNKQTVQNIIKPLRNLGIPAVGIVDVDVFKEGGVNWTRLLGCANMPPISHAPLGALRNSIKTAMEASGLDMKRDGGVDILPPSDREAAINLIEQLNDYGVFVVPFGELESWLKPLDVSGHGPAWLVKMFEAMGSDPESPDYVRPEEGDVWMFIHSIRTWLHNPLRKGIPI
jgi:energy-coupling factor transporter ATP-binding protein EcfA2